MFEALDNIDAAVEFRYRPFRDPDGNMLYVVAHS
jgi:hypothetical protein